MNKNFFGPFCRASKDDVWHWMENCPDFPHIENPQSMITSTYPENSNLCKKCTELDILSSKGSAHGAASK